MEIKIGVRQVAREISLDIAGSAQELLSDYNNARQSETPLLLTDANGHQVMIPVEAIGYIEFGQEHARPVGFGQLN
ncbi:MAG: DUF3107 domain-containing protein [Propionibacteriaceae bacterium]|jgi:hypothetical protein|nr:DUF3107 domain-containing protein [Propionibacteriaceae bacterium]